MLSEEDQLYAKKKEIASTGGQLLNKYVLNAYSVTRQIAFYKSYFV